MFILLFEDVKSQDFVNGDQINPSVTVAAPPNCSFQLENPDFENPDILVQYGSSGLYFEDDANMIGWKTTAIDGKIERKLALTILYLITI